MLIECAIAQGFLGVPYRYHRDFFELLGYVKIAAQFGEIWERCEPYMKDEPYKPRVLNQEPSYWLPYLWRTPMSVGGFWRPCATSWSVRQPGTSGGIEPS